MRAPREGAGFAVLPVLTGGRGRGTRGSFGWAAAVAAVIIAAAVLGGRTQVGPAASVDPGARTAWPVATASGGPLVSPAVEPESEPLQPLLRDGSIDGQLLLIEGRLLAERLLAERWDCPGTAAADLPCVRYSFWGLDGVTVAWSGTTAVDLSTVPSQPGESPGTLDTWWEGTFVVVPEDGRLRLLGLLVGNLASPTTVPLALEAPRRFPNDSSPFDILPVAGWLANTKGTSCFGPIGHGACPAQISSSVPGADGVLRPSLCNALMLARKGAAFPARWRERMSAVFDGTWSRHSCQEAGRLWAAMPDAVHVVPQRYFYRLASTPAGGASRFSS